jgi:tellurite resistance protein TerC
MQSPVPIWAWVALAVTVFGLLGVDLVAHRGGHGGSRRAAMVWTLVWILAGLGAGASIWAGLGAKAGQEYLAAYLIEKSLSVDNLFVFLIIFQSLKIRADHQHQVLFWGIFGALVFRAIFIFLGVAALEKYDWIAFVFGAILLWAAWRAWREDPAEQHESGLVVWLSRHLPVTHRMENGTFTVREGGRLLVTPLALALVAVELTDIVFAVDSVPAALSVSRDRFIVYSSNAFAILGLRALYIVIAQTLRDLRYLHYGLAVVLAMAAVKLMLAEWIHIPPLISIGAIVLTIGIAVGASLLRARGRGGRDATPGRHAAISEPLLPSERSHRPA